MIDKIKEYIGEVEAFQTQNKEELEAFRITARTVPGSGRAQVMLQTTVGVPL